MKLLWCHGDENAIRTFLKLLYGNVKYHILWCHETCDFRTHVMRCDEIAHFIVMKLLWCHGDENVVWRFWNCYTEMGGSLCYDVIAMKSLWGHIDVLFGHMDRRPHSSEQACQHRSKKCNYICYHVHNSHWFET